MTSPSILKRALVIDDDPHVREMLCVLLETIGFEVDTLHDGIDAVELKQDYRVILLDMRMPIFSGTQLADYWKMTTPDILRRVIFLTGYSQQSSDWDHGAFATIAKPFEYADMLRTIEACSQQPLA
jgi:FixJ family two-component response regulator